MRIDLALMKKGLRQAEAQAIFDLVSIDLALMKKGLSRRLDPGRVGYILYWPCPDEEGIKTIS